MIQKAFLVAILALVLAAAARPAGAVVVPLSAEIGLGREAAQFIEGNYPMSQDPMAKARVERIGRRLASVCTRPDLPFEFHVVDTPDINAFALPGGFVYVFRGLLQAVPNDDALAFILGHEIAHATERHSLKQFEKSQLVRIITVPLRGVVGTFGRDMANLLLRMHFSREDEQESDQLGLRTAVAAGFSLDSGVLAMDTLLKMANKGMKLPEFLSSHPATEHRKTAMAALAKGLEQAPVLPLAPGAAAIPVLVWDAPPQAPAATALFPLAAGSTWTYSLSMPEGGDAKAVVSVVEERPGDTRGVFRVETVYSAGVTAASWVAPTGEAVLSRPAARGADEPWRVEWRMKPGDGFVVVGRETIRVPAGEFACTRVRRLAANGSVIADGWFSAGVGLVKAVWPAQGVAQELLTYRVPNPQAVQTAAGK